MNDIISGTVTVFQVTVKQNKDGGTLRHVVGH